MNQVATNAREMVKRDVLDDPDSDAEKRRAALAYYDILDMPSTHGFDGLVQIARQVCDAPIALIGFVDRDRQWFKARIGFELDEIPISQSICVHALRKGGVFVIPDLTLDIRTRDNGLVREKPHLRFYAGVVLATPDGIPFGTLCVFDIKPRPAGLTEAQAANMRILADQIMTHLDLRRTIAERDEAMAQRARAEAALRQDADWHEALIEMEQVIVSAAGDLDVILTAVVKGALKAIPHCEGAAIEMREGDDVVYRAASGHLVPYLGLRLALGNSLSGACLRSGKPLHCADAKLDDRVDIEAVRKIGSRALIVAPILRQDEFVGVLKLGSRTPGVFSPRDLLTAQLIAGAMAAGYVSVDEAKAIQSLRENEELLRLAQGAAEIGIFDTDVETSLTRGSEQFFRLFGLNVPSLVVPTHVLENLVRPEDRHKTMNQGRRKTGPEATHVEYRITRADTGEERWVACYATHVLGKEGKLARLIGTAQDVTDRRRDEMRRALLLALDERVRGLDDPSAIMTVACEMLGADLAAARVGYAEVDAGGTFFLVMRSWQAPELTGLEDAQVALAGLDYLSVAYLKAGTIVSLRAVADDATPFARLPTLAAPILRNGRWVALLFVQTMSPFHWTPHDHAAIGDVAGRMQEAIDRAQAARALRQSETRLRLAQRAARTGTFELDYRTDQLSASSEFYEIYGIAEEAGASRHAIMQMVVADDLEAIVQSENPEKGQVIADAVYRIKRPDTGDVVWISRRAEIVRNDIDEPVLLRGTVQNITQAKQNEARQVALLALGDRLRDLTHISDIAFMTAELLGKTMDGSRAGYGTVNSQRNTVEIRKDWHDDRLSSLAGVHTLAAWGTHVDDLRRSERVVIADTQKDSRIAAAAPTLVAHEIRSLIALPVMEQKRLVAIFYVTKHRPYHWAKEEIIFARNVADRARAAIARIEAEEGQRLLNDELSHRLKNTLAMVQAIATQTMRNAPSIKAARETLSARLLTLGRAHEILLHRSIEPTDLRQLIVGAVSLHSDDQPNRIRLSGPRVEIGPRPGLSLALMLHELATNATKYGALSVSDGFVSIDWTVTGENEDALFDLVWQERGGPPAAPPLKKGFGSRLIERGLAGSIEGKSMLIYGVEGVSCQLTAPLADIRSDG